MQSFVEHANITVSNLEQSIHFFTTALPDFRIRKRFCIENREWAHLGTDTTYVALVECAPADQDFDRSRKASSTRIGINHLGFVVENVDTVCQQLRDANYRGGFGDGEIFETSYRRSAYYLDADGNEFEFMQYLTDDIDQRNYYDV